MKVWIEELYSHKLILVVLFSGLKPRCLPSERPKPVHTGSSEGFLQTATDIRDSYFRISKRLIRLPLASRSRLTPQLAAGRKEGILWNQGWRIKVLIGAPRCPQIESLVLPVRLSCCSMDALSEHDCYISCAPRRRLPAVVSEHYPVPKDHHVHRRRITC